MNRATSLLVYALLPYLGAFAGARSRLARGPRRLGPGPVTTVLLLAVGIPSLGRPADSPLRHALERDADRIACGQVWRLVTALVQQDSGVAGTVANLAALLATAAPALTAPTNDASPGQGAAATGPVLRAANGDQPSRPTPVMSFRGRTRHTYDDTRDGRMTL